MSDILKTYYSINVARLLLGVFCLLPFTYSHAQDDEIKIVTEYSDQGIKLRWAPLTYKCWEDGIQSGYVLERFTEVANGNNLNQQEIISSKTLLLDKQVPLPKAAWENFGDNRYATVAKEALYFENDDLGPNPTLADAVANKEIQEYRHLFSLFAAEQDFDVAQGMAIGYFDEDFETNTKYFYRLSIPGTDFLEVIEMETNVFTSYPPVSGLTGIGEDSVALLTWPIKEAADTYSSFDIERSEDGINFELVNDLPYIFMAQDGRATEEVQFRDELPANGVTYYYRVYGRTPFGGKSEVSETITIVGREDRISDYSIQVVVRSLSETGAGISWNIPDESSDQEKIVSFTILRSLSATGMYDEVGSAPAQTNTFNESDTPLEFYYKVSATDVNGHEYESFPTLVQLDDATPPTIPLNLSAKFTTSKRLDINWSSNKEADLNGYYLYEAYGSQDLLTRLHNELVEESEYTYMLTEDIVADTIYLCISASDLRGNASEKSEIIAVAIPDRTPPAAPDLFKVESLPAGIALGWKFSESDDVIKHLLERKPKNAPGWVVVREISKVDEINYFENITETLAPTCFIDSSSLIRRPYEYRIVAQDATGNMASSSIIDITPLYASVAGLIEELKFDSISVQQSLVIPFEEAYNAINYAIENYKQTQSLDVDTLELTIAYNVMTSEEYNNLSTVPVEDAILFLQERQENFWDDLNVNVANISWSYANLDQLLYFRIYKNANGQGMMLYETIHISDLMDGFRFADEVKSGDRHTYRITAVHDGSVISEQSKSLLVRVP